MIPRAPTVSLVYAAKLGMPPSSRTRHDRKRKVADFKADALRTLWPVALRSNQFYVVRISFHFRLRTKTGKIVRRDVTNLTEFLSDVLAQKAGIDDSQWIAVEPQKTDWDGEEYVRLEVWTAPG